MNPLLNKSFKDFLTSMVIKSGNSRKEWWLISYEVVEKIRIIISDWKRKKGWGGEEPHYSHKANSIVSSSLWSIWNQLWSGGMTLRSIWALHPFASRSGLVGVRSEWIRSWHSGPGMWESCDHPTADSLARGLSSAGCSLLGWIGVWPRSPPSIEIKSFLEKSIVSTLQLFIWKISIF